MKQEGEYQETNPNYRLSISRQTGPDTNTGWYMTDPPKRQYGDKYLK